MGERVSHWVARPFGSLKETAAGDALIGHCKTTRRFNSESAGLVGVLTKEGMLFYVAKFKNQKCLQTKNGFFSQHPMRMFVCLS